MFIYVWDSEQAMPIQVKQSYVTICDHEPDSFIIAMLIFDMLMSPWNFDSVWYASWSVTPQVEMKTLCGHSWLHHNVVFCSELWITSANGLHEHNVVCMLAVYLGKQ